MGEVTYCKECDFPILIAGPDGLCKECYEYLSCSEELKTDEYVVGTGREIIID